MARHPLVGKALDWAGQHTKPITEAKQRGAAHLMPGYDMEQVSTVISTAVQRTISDRLRMTKPELAGQGLGLELWRFLVRVHGAPEQPTIQRACPRRVAYPQAVQGHT